MSDDRDLCRCGCGQTFIRPKCAPHKQFVNTAHRNGFWVEQQRRRRQAEVEQETEQGWNEVMI